MRGCVEFGSLVRGKQLEPNNEPRSSPTPIRVPAFFGSLVYLIRFSQERKREGKLTEIEGRVKYFWRVWSRNLNKPANEPKGKFGWMHYLLTKALKGRRSGHAHFQPWRGDAPKSKRLYRPLQFRNGVRDVYRNGRAATAQGSEAPWALATRFPSDTQAGVLRRCEQGLSRVGVPHVSVLGRCRSCFPAGLR